MRSFPFRELLEAQSTEWIEYCRKAWENSDRPPGLEPSNLLSMSIDYGQLVYRWFENKYQGAFLDTFQVAHRTIDEMNIVSNEMASFWHLYFDPWSIWKQLRSLYVLTSALKGPTNINPDLSAAYVVAQGVPSMAIDRILDTPSYRVSRTHLEQLAPFCIIAYGAGLKLIRSADLPRAIEDIFLRYSQLMHAYMWKESAQRYILPNLTANTLDDYINGESRLLSSVFYSITIEWAYALADIEPGPATISMSKHFRRVRQLNDEIMDAEEDFVNGIATFPIMHALNSKQYGQKMLSLLEKGWSSGRNGTRIDDGLAGQAHSVMVQAGSFDSAAQHSWRLLSMVINFAQRNFSPGDAFELTLIINQRLGTLLRHADAGWQRVPDEYEPQITQQLKSANN